MRVPWFVARLCAALLATATGASAQGVLGSEAARYSIEAVGSSVGSAAGALLGGAIGLGFGSGCPPEEPGCLLAPAAVVAGRRITRFAGSEPTLAGQIVVAGVGVVVGAAVGVALVGDSDNETRLVFGDTVTQGLLTALGSRLF